MPDEHNEIDALLSALVDGELDPQAESELRERVAREPELAERLASFQRMDDALRELPAPQVPEDLAARLHAKIAEQTSQPLQPAAHGLASTSRRRPVAPPRRRARAWSVAAGLAAVAAAAALYFLLPAEQAEPTRFAERAPDPIPSPQQSLVERPIAIEETLPVEQVLPVEQMLPTEQVIPIEQLAAQPIAQPIAQPVTQPAELAEPEPLPEIEPLSLLASAGDEELGIALYYDELADLEILEQLELLEMLVAIEQAEQS